MNKYLMISLLLVGAAFAGRDITTGTEWNNYAQACCAYATAYGMLDYEYGNFAIFNGQGCSDDGALLDEASYLSDVMWGDGEQGLIGYYYDYESACIGAEGSAECAAAKSTLRSRISTAKGIFLNGRMFAYAKARQAVLDNMNHGCGTGRSSVLNMMTYSTGLYNECKSDPIDYCLRRG